MSFKYDVNDKLLCLESFRFASVIRFMESHGLIRLTISNQGSNHRFAVDQKFTNFVCMRCCGVNNCLSLLVQYLHDEHL